MPVSADRSWSRTPRGRARSELAVDPCHEGAAVELVGLALATGTAFPLAELLFELCELFAEPQHTDFLVEVRILELLAQMPHHGLGARLREIAVVHDRAFRRRACDDEEPARTAL